MNSSASSQRGGQRHQQQQQQQRPRPQYHFVRVTNVAPHLTEAELMSLFSNYALGRFWVKICTRQSYTSKKWEPFGTIIIKYVRRDDATYAVHELDGLRYENCVMNMQWSNHGQGGDRRRQLAQQGNPSDRESKTQQQQHGSAPHVQQHHDQESKQSKQSKQSQSQSQARGSSNSQPSSNANVNANANARVSDKNSQNSQSSSHGKPSTKVHQSSAGSSASKASTVAKAA